MGVERVPAQGRILRRFFFRCFLFLLLSFCLMSALPAAETPPLFRSPHKGDLPLGMLSFKSYDSAQGLGNLSIWAMEQDADGFLWVGTVDGLFRYDGSRFNMLGVADGLPAARIKALLQGERSQFWIGTIKGLALKEGNRIRELHADAGLPANEIFALAIDREGRLWVAMDVGLFRQRPGSLFFDPLPGWPAKAMARALWMDGDAMYTVSQIKLLRIDLNGTAAIREVPGPWRERLDAVVRDRQGRMWVRSRGGLWMRQGNRGDFTDLSRNLGVATYDGHLRVTPRGGLLIPTTDGLVRVTDDTWEYLSTAFGLPTPWTNRAMEDREGCLWVGGLGLFRGLAHEAWRRHTQLNGIPGGVVWTILKDQKGRIWAGTTNGLCSPKNGIWERVPQTKQNQAILRLALAKDGALWMGGAPPRLRRWLPESNEWLEFSRPGSTISGLIFGADGTLWINTHREGVYCIPPLASPGGTYKIEPFFFPGSEQNEMIQSMSRGGGDRLWMAGPRGLFLQEKGRWRLLGTDDGLLSANVLSVFEDDENCVWLSYEDRQGLGRFAYRAGRLEPLVHFDPARGLEARKIYFVRKDALARIWVGTSQGVYVLFDDRWHHFGASEGMPGDDCEGGVFLAEPNGDVWIGTLGGLGHFDSARFSGRPRPPPAFILSMQYGQTKLERPFPEKVDVTHRNASVEFQFTGLNYNNENRVLLQIRLVGLDDEWRFNDIRQIRFAKLPPRQYSFQVRAGYDKTSWGPVATASFRVLPAWWQTWWFYAAVALALLGGVLLFFRWRYRILHRRNFELEKIVQARTKALAAANESLQKLTVTDTLTGLRNRRFIDLTIEEELAKVNRDYHALKKSADKDKQVNLDLIFMMVDLDHFKEVNDRFGHAAGDLVLKQIRDRLLQAVRDMDTVVRWGGEEFLLVARKCDRGQAQNLADRVKELVSREPFAIGNGQTLLRTCSLGFAPYPIARGYPPEAVSWTQVVEMADRCLYAAKESGRNGWVGLREGPSPERVSAFISQPEVEIKAGGWEILTSFPDVSALVWQQKT